MPSVRSVMLSLIAVSSARADISLLRLEVSRDEASWQSRVSAQPGDLIRIRASMTYQSTAGIRPAGFAFMTWQPVVSRWAQGDILEPFATRGNNLNGGAVADAPGAYGRTLPFAATGPTTSDPYRGHLQSVSGVSYLRIARSSITNWIGDGATTGTRAANNFNGAGGLAIVQKGAPARTTRDPEFNPSVENVVIFKFAVRLGEPGGARTLGIDAPIEGITRNTTTGSRQASWFRDLSDPFGAIRADVVVIGAQIDFVPAPSAAAVLGVFFTLGRRRRVNDPGR